MPNKYIQPPPTLVKVGHALLACASSRLLIGSELPCTPPPAQPISSISTEEGNADPPASPDESSGAALCPLESIGRAYALRNAAAHACRPTGSPELLQALLLDFGAWFAIIEAGKC